MTPQPWLPGHSSRHQAMYHCDLIMMFDLGYLVNFDETGQDQNHQWIPKSTALRPDSETQSLTHRGLRLRVIHNDQILLDTDLDNLTQLTVNHTLAFDLEPKVHNIEITLCRFTARHMPLTHSDRSSRSAVRLTALSLADVDVLQLYTTQAQGPEPCDCLCQNSTMTWQYQTPIYTWLVPQKQPQFQKQMSSYWNTNQ